MVTIFNRRDLLETFDMKRFNEVRELLEKHGIPYTWRTASQNGGMGAFFSNRSRFGSIGVKPDRDLEYTIFVRKADYEQAVYLQHTEHLL